MHWKALTSWDHPPQGDPQSMPSLSSEQLNTWLCIKTPFSLPPLPPPGTLTPYNIWSSLSFLMVATCLVTVVLKMCWHWRNTLSRRNLWLVERMVQWHYSIPTCSLCHFLYRPERHFESALFAWDRWDSFVHANTPPLCHQASGFWFWQWGRWWRGRGGQAKVVWWYYHYTG